jgi:Family of unknown function (DUF5941)
MSAAATAARAPEAAVRPDQVGVWRDDGPLARAIGRVLGPRLPLPAPVLILAGLLPLVAVVAAAGGDASHPLAAAVLAWVLLCAGASRGRPHRARIRWCEPPLVRLTEYLGLIWVAAIAGESSYPAAFGLLCALAFRHYDLVYRLRHRGVTPAPWVDALSGGWDGRLVAALVLLVAGALPAGYYVAAAVLGVVFVGESVAGWVVVGRVQRPTVYEDEEDEGQ